MSSSSKVSSLKSVGFTNSDDELQRLEAKRQKLAEKWRKIDENIRARQERRAKMSARRRQARDLHYSFNRVDEDDGEIKPVTKRKRVFGQSSESEEEEEEVCQPPLKKPTSDSGDLDDVFVSNEPPSPEHDPWLMEVEEEDIRDEEPHAGPSPTPSPTPSLTSLISFLSLTSLVSLESSAPSPQASKPRRGRPKKKVSARAKDALGRFLPGPARVRPVTKRKRRTELELLLDYPN